MFSVDRLPGLVALRARKISDGRQLIDVELTKELHTLQQKDPIDQLIGHTVLR